MRFYIQSTEDQTHILKHFVSISNNFNINWTDSNSGTEITDDQLRAKYNIFKKRIEEYSQDVNRYHQDYTVKYKIWLILFSMSGIIATLFTIIFFLFELKFEVLFFLQLLRDYGYLLISFSSCKRF